MKSLLISNIYDVDETIIIMGSCLGNMQPIAFRELEKMSSNIYSLCLEESHINMAITKIGAMLSTGKVKRVIFASVDKSPHCVQLHYIRHEVERMMDLSNITVINYVAVQDKLVEIDPEVIALSKNLSALKTHLD